MTVAENLGPLVGRAVEIEVLRSEVAAVRTGIPRIVVVQGDALTELGQTTPIVLGAFPYLQRCDRELLGCGLTPAKRRDPDPTMLTPQEQAVARLVAVGMSNRQVAGELFISVKTVQFHLTHIYTKLGVSSRAELAAQYRN
jgi:DNA-binding NarL/FixJ family response regulator